MNQEWSEYSQEFDALADELELRMCNGDDSKLNKNRRDVYTTPERFEAEIRAAQTPCEVPFQQEPRVVYDIFTGINLSPEKPKNKES